MNGYKAFYNGKEVEVYAETSYKAQLQAAEKFGLKPNKSWKVHVVLCELDTDGTTAGTQVVHRAVD